MPVNPTYPGVYIEEVKSQVHTITGVATSITAFVGWANKGPIDRAGLVQSFSDFERMFGGLNKDSYLGYSVQQFFANGGSTAYVVRLYDETSATTATLTLQDTTPVNVLKIDARNPGAWGASVQVITKKRAAPNDARFSLSASYTDSSGRAVSESYDNLSMDKNDPRYVQSVVNDASQLITVTVLGAPPTPNPPADTSSTPLGGSPSDGTLLQPDQSGFETRLTNLANGTDPRLDNLDLFNLLVVPGETTATVVQTMEAYCKTRRALMIVDCAEGAAYASLTGGPDTHTVSPSGENGAFYFPWLKAPDPLDENRSRAMPPSGFVAGVYARIDAARGVWKAPAGTEAGVGGVSELDTNGNLTDDQNGTLNVLGINCIRSFPIYGIVLWGARTLVGANDIGSEWKYVPVRRMALFLEESLYRGTKWVVFEPNDEPLWAQIRLNLTAFMMSLYRQGAFQGTKPSDAFFVKCDSETTTQDDINKGIVNILVGFAPLKPAEFVVIKLSQMAGQVV